MWDGNYKAKKQVSLRGKSVKQQNKQEIKKKLADDRALRALEKRKQVAARTIQSVARGSVARASLHRTTRAGFDKKLSDIRQVSVLVGPSFVPPSTVMQDLVRELLFFYAPTQDMGRLATFCALFSRSMLLPDPRQSFRGTLIVQGDAPPEASVRRTVWRRQVSQLISLCFASVVKDSQGDTRWSAALDFALACFTALDDLVLAGELPVGTQLDALVRQHSAPSAVHRYGVVAFELLAEILDQGTTHAPVDAVPRLVTLICNGLVSAGGVFQTAGDADWKPHNVDAVAQAIATTLFFVPKACTHERILGSFICPAQDVEHNLLRAVFRFYASPKGALSTSEAVRVLGNLVDLLNVMLDRGALRTNPGLFLVYMQTLLALVTQIRDAASMLRRSPQHAAEPKAWRWLRTHRALVRTTDPPKAKKPKPSNPSEAKFRTFASFAPSTSKLAPSASKLAPQKHNPGSSLTPVASPPDQALDPHSAAASRQLAQSTFVRTLFRLVLGTFSKRENAPLQTFLQCLETLCALYTAVSASWMEGPNGKGSGKERSLAAADSVMFAVAFSSWEDSLVRSLWQSLLAWKLLHNQSYRKFVNAGSMGNPLLSALPPNKTQYLLPSTKEGVAVENLSAYRNTVSFACACLSKLVPAMDDVELFEQQVLFKKPQLREITHFLRDLLYQNIWVDGVFATTTTSNTKLREGTDRQVVASTQAMLFRAIETFGQLYERSSRHQYMAPEEWLFPSIPPSELGITADIARQASSLLMGNDNDDDESSDDGSDSDDMDVDEDGGRQREAPSSRAGTGDDIGVGLGFSLSGASERGNFVLRYLSQTVSFDLRVAIFTAILDSLVPEESFFNFQSRIKVTVNRNSLYQDAFEQLHNNAQQRVDFRQRIQVSFVNEQGLPEAGIDGGGVFKEFLIEFSKHAFDPENGLWKSTSDHKLFPNPDSGLEDPNHLDHFEFIGRMLGKSVSENVLIEPEFAAFFLNMLIGKVNHIHDLQSLDPEMYHHLMTIKSMDNPEDLGLTFTVTIPVGGGKYKDVDLIPSGSSIAVTKDNYLFYISHMAHYRLDVSMRRQCEAFRRGFSELVPTKCIQMFQPAELQNVIGGSDKGFDVEDMKKHSTYGGGYHPSQPYVHWFWEVVQEFNNQQRAMLLDFVTSNPRPPLQGFQRLRPCFTVSQVNITSDGERLPTASTCVNLLKLPKYSSKEVLREKLLFVISSGAGFELS